MSMSVIPWYKSNTLRGLLIAALAQLTQMLGITDAATSEDITGAVDKLLDVVSLIATAYAAWARSRQPTPPVALTKAGAAAKSSQGGFARPLMLAILLAVTVPAVVMLPGCTSIGLQAPINLTQRIDNAYGNVTAVVNTAIAGRERGQLTAEEGVFISDLAKNARVVLQAADTLNKVGDTSGAEARLLLALGILQQLDDYLNGKQVTP